MPTCVCYERDDIYVTIYNKPVQRFETDLVTKKIGNGMQTIFGSEQIATKFLCNQETAFFRVEMRWRFDQEGTVSFIQRNTETLHMESVQLLGIVKDCVYKAGLVHRVPIAALWVELWK